MSVNVFAPFWEIEDSYGRVANELADGIEALGVHVNRYGEGTPRVGERPHRLSLGGFLLAYPTNFKYMGGLSNLGMRVAITMFESTKLPPGWADVLNRMNAVIVPSQWNAEMFKGEGVTVPVYRVPLGISNAYLKVKRRGDTKRPYTFLVIADRGSRKRWDKVMDAFYLAFQQDTRVRLVMKSRLPLGFNVSNPNIEMVSGDYTDEQMARLFTRCDCIVSATSGEGFDLPPREFAATGGLAIVTNWGGSSDDLPCWGLGIRSKGLVPAWKGEKSLDGVGEWADADVEHLSQLMKMVVDNRDHFTRVAKLNGEWVRDNYRWSAFAKRCYEVYEEVAHASHNVTAHAV
jgi:glycosyltransferase involved in cell wall biosynthesis